MVTGSREGSLQPALDRLWARAKHELSSRSGAGRTGYMSGATIRPGKDTGRGFSM